MIKYLIAFILIVSPCLAGMGIGGFPYPGPGMVVEDTCAFTDCFDRADGSLGPNWTTTTSQSAPAIESGKVKGNTSDGRAGAWYNAVTYTSNQKVCAKMSSPSDTGGITVRTQSGQQTMYLATTNGTNLVVRKMVAGSFSTLGTYTNISSGDTVCLSASGTIPTNLEVSVNSVVVGSPTDASSTITGGAPGVFFYTIGTVRVDDFDASDL